MKKIITITTFLLLVCIASFAQQVQLQASNAELAKQLLAQSKSQKTLSTVLVIGGLTLVGIGAGLSLRGFGDWSSHKNYSDGSAWTITGGCAIAAGIPLAFIAKHNKKKAELLLKNNQDLSNTSFVKGRIYSIGIKLDL